MPNAVIFSCEMTEWKASLEVYGELLRPVFNSENKPAFEAYLYEGGI